MTTPSRLSPDQIATGEHVHTVSDRTLTPADVTAVATAVVDLLRTERCAPPPSRLIDAAELASILGVSRETVYTHADELGVVRIGDGARPRQRFDLERATAAWTARSAGARSQEPDLVAVEPNRGGRPRRASGASDDLLPIRGRRAA